MIGLVIVSHSAKLAEGVCELAAQLAQGKVLLAPAGGTGDASNPIGTNALLVVDAIGSLAGADVVLVLMDLGSARLSAETALEFLSEDQRARVRLCPGPLVEGAVAAASLAAAGAPVEEILAEVSGAAARKAVAEPPEAPEERTVRIRNPLGLHARPAAHLVRVARGSPARLAIENLTRKTGPASASSLTALLALEARQGDELRLRAAGAGARALLEELARWFDSGCGEGEMLAPPSRARPRREGHIQGLAASEGIAIGPLVRLETAPPAEVEPTAADPGEELRRLERALEEARDQTRRLFEWARIEAGEDMAGIFEAQAVFLEDPALLEEASRLIEVERLAAEAAWERAWRGASLRLEAVADEYLRARAQDVADAGRRVLAGLKGATRLPAPERPSILVAAELLPSQVSELDRDRVLGVCLESGSPSAHSVILARALGIPVVAGLGPGLAGVGEGTLVAIDGASGAVWIAPDEETLRELEGRRKWWLARRETAQASRLEPARTRDGRRLRVAANVNSVEGAAEAVACGAEGVGVLRTEFLFLDRNRAPDEDEQAAAYQAIAEALEGRPLVIRTLDVGADKPLPYVETGSEANPFLGRRGIRFSLAERSLFRTQLRAIARVATRYPVEVLLPMVSCLEELREAKAEIAGIERQAGVRLKVGVMIEVPSAVALAPELAREADFFSIGTNDLVQYVMAADRTNPRVAALADAFHPAVLRLVREAVRAAHEARLPATLCGELAAEPLAAPLLVGLGIDEFSVSAPLVPRIKEAIRAVDAAEAEKLAGRALELDSAAAVRRLLAASTSTAG